MSKKDKKDKKDKKEIDMIDMLAQKQSELERFKQKLSENRENHPHDYFDRETDEQIEYLLNKLKDTPIIVNRLDYYGNSIPLGAFCYAVAFVLYGFYESRIMEKPDKFTYLILFFFGGLGQITAGIFEYIKARTFPSIVYLLYGTYFVSFSLLNYYYSTNDDIFRDCKKVFFGTWAGLSFPVLIGSFRTNLILLIQNLSACEFFIVKCIGECIDNNSLRGKTAGISELVTGFFSLYLCFSQIINEHLKKNILPTIKLKDENEIDIN